MTAVAEPRVIDFGLILRGNPNLKEQIEVPPELTVLKQGEAVPPGFFAFRLLSAHHGDERVVWDSSSLSQINEAKRMFVELIKKGLKPFRVGLNGKRSSEVMTEFDPRAEEVIFIPMPVVVGG